MNVKQNWPVLVDFLKNLDAEQKDELTKLFPEDLAYISTFRDEPGLARFYIMR